MPITDISRQLKNDLNARARKANPSGFREITLRDLRSIAAYYPNCCQCGTPDNLTFDHVTPLELEGENVIENLQVLCEGDNKAKGATYADYRPTDKPILKHVERADADDYPVGIPPLDTFESKAEKDTPDWDTIETLYITGEMSLRELASAEEVSENAVLRRAVKYRWADARRQYRLRRATRVHDLLLEEGVKAAVIAASTAKAVIVSWLNSVKEDATASDALNASKLLILIDGGPTSRNEEIVKDWRDVARDAGMQPEQVIQEFERIAKAADLRE